MMTPEIIAKLEQGFAYGYTDLEACAYAGISKSPFYEYQDKHPEFKERKEQLRELPVLAAKKNVQDALNGGDKDMTKWYLERKKKDEFSTKTVNDHNHNLSLPEQINALRRRQGTDSPSD